MAFGKVAGPRRQRHYDIFGYNCRGVKVNCKSDNLSRKTTIEIARSERHVSASCGSSCFNFRNPKAAAEKGEIESAQLYRQRWISSQPGRLDAVGQGAIR
jgi:hypothetical protein